MNVILYHASEDLFRDSLAYREDGSIFNKDRAVAEFNAGNYEEVATFVFPFDKAVGELIDRSLTSIFASTQNNVSAWRPANPTRSTSVGDIIKVGEELYIVASCGFDKLPTLGLVKR